MKTSTYDGGEGGSEGPDVDGVVVEGVAEEHLRGLEVEGRDLGGVALVGEVELSESIGSELIIG